MTQRDRLIELLDSKINTLDLEDCDSIWMTEKLDELADYLLANGVIVPPCKVGDVLYTTYDGDTKVERLNVNEILIKIHDDFVWFVINYKYYFSFNSFGKTVFLSREEAEKALAERIGE